MNNKHFNKDYLYILPAVMISVVFFISSIGFSVFISFFDWDGFSPMKFAGLKNYIRIFTDKNLLISVANTVVWVVGSLLVTFVIPLIFAILIDNSYRSSVFKNMLYFPKAFSATVAGMIISVLLSTSGIPAIMKLLGRSDLVFDWLSVPYFNTLLMIAMTCWQGIGLNLLLFLGGIRSVDVSPIEAATIDGIGNFMIYPKVVFPMIKPTMTVAFLLSMVNSFKVFDSIWVMTKGGPYRTSETLALSMYVESFINGRLGSGAAIAVVLSAIVTVFMYKYLKESFK